jgi:hypothetical protein
MLAPPSTLQDVASRLARLLTRGGGELADPTPAGSELEFEPVARLLPLVRAAAPRDVWAVDGGQGLVADARCVQVVVTRAARVRYSDGTCVMEDEGPLRAQLLGARHDRPALAELGLDLPAATTVDTHLLRDRWEWDAVAACVEEAEAGALVLVDGDLQPDWRIPSTFIAALLRRASDRNVMLASITKHSSLARGGAPLLGQLEMEGEALLGPRAMWWAPLARTRSDLAADGAGIQVLAARLDPDARFGFRVDLPGDVEPEPALAAISALCDDAAFPGYPYPLSVADRLAACPRWLRGELAAELDELLEGAGIPWDVRERAFADRHDLMERS